MSASAAKYFPPAKKPRMQVDSVPVPSFEEAEALIPTATRACRGDTSEEVMTAVLKILKLAVPEWTNVNLSELSVEELCGAWA